MKEKPLIIKPLLNLGINKTGLNIYDVIHGLYHLKGKHEIELGTFEKDTIHVLVHELMHKILHEKINLQSCIAWDNIADNFTKDFLNIKEDLGLNYPAKKRIIEKLKKNR